MTFKVEHLIRFINKLKYNDELNIECFIKDGDSIEGRLEGIMGFTYGPTSTITPKLILRLGEIKTNES